MFDDDYYKMFYSDLDGNGRVDRFDEDIFLIEENRRKQEEEQRRLDEEEDDCNFDEDDELHFDEEDSLFGLSFGKEEESFDNDDDVEAYRQGFIRNVKKYGVVATQKLTALQTGKRYEGDKVPLRYLFKEAYMPDEVIDFKRALFERFPEVKDSFDYEDDDQAATIIYEFLQYDTAKGLQMWHYLLNLFSPQLLEGLDELKKVLIECVLEEIILDEVQDCEALSDFFVDEFVSDYFFKQHVWERSESDEIEAVFGCCVRTRKFEATMQIFQDVTKRNGGFTKKTLESMLYNMIYEIPENCKVPEKFQNFIVEQANSLGIKAKKIIKTLNEVLAEAEE